jgi:hypothetical protein
VGRVDTCIRGVEEIPLSSVTAVGGEHGEGGLAAYDAIYYCAEVGLEGSKGHVVKGGV